MFPIQQHKGLIEQLKIDNRGGVNITYQRIYNVYA